jgi:hypothetical protein
MSFIKIPIYFNNNTEYILNYTKLYLYNLFLLNKFDDFNDSIECTGFFNENHSLFLFVDVTKCKLNIHDIYNENNLWFVLVDEMVNKKNMCNIVIDDFVNKFFVENHDFCLLLDKKREAYEIPIVGYVGKQEDKLAFTHVFGIPTKEKDAIMGPYYYFTNFNNAVKDGCWSSDGKPVVKKGVLLTNNEYGRYKKGGIVRFALFTGITKYIENYPTDKIDESSTKKQRIHDKELNNQYEQLTMRISDHDGKWTEKADSCYLGDIELDNGTFLENTPMIVLKEYNQQISLSYHYIHSLYWKEKFDKNHSYTIM